MEGEGGGEESAHLEMGWGRISDNWVPGQTQAIKGEKNDHLLDLKGVDQEMGDLQRGGIGRGSTWHLLVGNRDQSL